MKMVDASLWGKRAIPDSGRARSSGSLVILHLVVCDVRLLLLLLQIFRLEASLLERLG